MSREQEEADQHEGPALSNQRRISSVAHPFAASVFPGLCGLSLGIVSSSCGSVIRYRFANSFIPQEYLDSGVIPSYLSFAASISLILPWLVFLVCLLAGLLLMRFYCRNLRKHHNLLVGQLVLPKEEVRQLPILQRLTIEWPLWLLLYSWLGALCCSYGYTFQEEVVVTSGMGGLLASLMTTRIERRHIYEDAVRVLAESGTGNSSSSIGGLSRRAKASLLSVALFLCIFFAGIIRLTVKIAAATGELADIYQLLIF